MNRAIGAIDKTAGVNSFGMLYQWGRKDPFTPSTATSPARGATGGKDTQLYNATGTPINTNTYGVGGEWIHSATALNATQVATLINYPSTFYTGGSVPIASTGNLSNDWWNATIKTLYDPCPTGYRIPPNGTYNSFTTSSWSGSGVTTGRTWAANSSFFPASGYRTTPVGEFYVVGTYGFYWMSTPNSAAYGHNLLFNSGAVNPNHACERSYGFPVRCISE